MCNLQWSVRLYFQQYFIWKFVNNDSSMDYEVCLLGKRIFSLMYETGSKRIDVFEFGFSSAYISQYWFEILSVRFALRLWYEKKRNFVSPEKKEKFKQCSLSFLESFIRIQKWMKVISFLDYLLSIPIVDRDFHFFSSRLILHVFLLFIVSGLALKQTM
jgi:hypothetical protein